MLIMLNYHVQITGRKKILTKLIPRIENVPLIPVYLIFDRKATLVVKYDTPTHDKLK